MKFLAPALLSAAALTAQAATLAPRQADNNNNTTSPTPPPPAQQQPWTLSSLAIRKPSARAGNYPWITLRASISDPNPHTIGSQRTTGEPITVGPSTGTNCLATFLSLEPADTGNAEGPWNRSWACDDDGKKEGYWSMRVSMATPDAYRFVFTRVAAKFDAPSYGQFSKAFEGVVELVAGEGLSASCAGDGSCAYVLRDAPRAVVAREVVGEGEGDAARLV